jgi:hypothetical protein
MVMVSVPVAAGGDSQVAGSGVGGSLSEGGADDVVALSEVDQLPVLPNESRI